MHGVLCTGILGPGVYSSPSSPKLMMEGRNVTFVSYWMKRCMIISILLNVVRLIPFHIASYQESLKEVRLHDIVQGSFLSECQVSF